MPRGDDEAAGWVPKMKTPMMSRTRTETRGRYGWRKKKIRGENILRDY